MEQHPVPQHIAAFKFKLFGNLTVRQFFTLIIPVSLATAIYFSGIPFIIRLPLSLVIGAFGLVIALVPFGGMPFDRWLVAFIKAITSPTQRVWIKEKRYPQFLDIISAPPKVVERQQPEELSSQKKEKLMAYIKTLPKETASPLDIKEKIALGNIDFSVQTASIGAQTLTQEQFPPAIIWPTQPWQSSPKPQVEQKVSLETARPIEPEEDLPPIEKPKVALHAKPYVVHGLEKRLEGKKTQEARPVDITKMPYLNLASDTNYWIDNIIPFVTPDNKIQFLHGIGKTRARKLHFAPPANFDLSKLPIRGEKRFEISEELKKRFEDTSPPVVLPFEKRPEPLPIVTRNIPKPKPVSIPQKQQIMSESKRQQSPQNTTAAQPASFQDTSKFAVTDFKKTEGIKSPTSSAAIIPLTSTPNVISGLVTDANGSPLAGAVLVVRDQNGIPVRALKTNKLGQFLSATPLTSGKYSLEAESEEATFKPISIEAEDKIISPISIMAEINQNGRN